MSDSVTLWAVACQALLSMGFSRQESWNGLPFPSPRKPCHTLMLTWQLFLLKCTDEGSHLCNFEYCSNRIIICNQLDFTRRALQQNSQTFPLFLQQFSILSSQYFLLKSLIELLTIWIFFYSRRYIETFSDFSTDLFTQAVVQLKSLILPYSHLLHRQILLYIFLFQFTKNCRNNLYHIPNLFKINLRVYWELK